MEFNQVFADEVAMNCFQLYQNIGKKGKPQVGREWTKMACFIQTNSKNEIQIIGLATGTKCIGKSQRSSTGYLLNDSHAEVLARRLFLKYLYHQIRNSHAGNEETILSKCLISNKFVLKDGIKFHLFTTDVPCGDASIFVKASVNHQLPVKRKMRNPLSCECLPNVDGSKTCVDSCIKKQRLRCESQSSLDDGINLNKTHNSNTANVKTDINRTGAKCVPGGKQDLLADGENYHVTEVLRIKPGRGDRTLSMSCSDKIMKWCVLGLQGGLLSNLLKDDIFLKSVILSRGPLDKMSILRAFSLRKNVYAGSTLIIKTPIILQSQLEFSDCKENVLDNVLGRTVKKIQGSVTAAGASILYSFLCNVHEVSASGRKHGITKKDFFTLKSRCSICKHVLFQDFMSCLESLDVPILERSGTYYKNKHSCEEYEKKRTEFFQVFGNWIKKPLEEEQFSL